MNMRRWVDWVNIMLGVWLIASPWLFIAVGGYERAAWNSWSVGAGIVTLAFVAMYKPAVWSDMVGIMLGAWLIASPWLLRFDSAVAANAVITGMLVVGYASWAMGIDLPSGDGLAGSKRSHSRLTTA